MFVEGLYLLLASNAGIIAVVGAPGTRSDSRSGIFPNVAPDEPPMPYLVYVQASRATVLSYAGVNRLQQARFRFLCYASTYKVAKQLAQAVKLALDGFVGLLGDAGQTPLEQTIPSLEVDVPEPMLHGTTYGIALDYDFHYIDTGS